MKKGLLFILLILLFETSFSQAFQDTIPFRNDLGLIIIPITFNGIEKEFAFDTGAQITLSYGWAKENLKATKKTTTVTSSSGLKTRMRYYKSGKIQLASRKITGHRILNTPENDFFTCHKIDGILGVDIIKQFNWSIDYKNKILIMYPSNYTPKKVKNMHALSFEFSGNRPYVYLNRKGSRFKFLLDTGAGGDSNISTRNYTLTNIDEFPQRSFYTGNIDLSGTLTPMKEKTFQFPESTSNEVILSPLIDYNNEKSTKIGNRLWKGKELFLNLKKDRLYISSPKIEQSYSGYTCALIFSKNKMKISSIEVGSAPWKMGVRQGDEVLLYDGKKFTDFCSLDQYQRKIAKAGKSFELELTNGKKVTVSKREGM